MISWLGCSRAQGLLSVIHARFRHNSHKGDIGRRSGTSPRSIKSSVMFSQRLAIEEYLFRNEHSHCSLHLRSQCRSHISRAVAIPAAEVRDTYGLGRRKLCKSHPYQDNRVLGIPRSTLPCSSQPQHNETTATPGHTLNPHQTVSNPFLERSNLHKGYLGFHHLPEGVSSITLRL